MSARILCVDDDPNILQAFRRQLRKQFDIQTAEGGDAALELIDAQDPFAVVVSDMRMPGMDGVQLLSLVMKQSPDSVRIMLTGNADQQTAMNAVNQGSIFRFLTKPCPPETLARALEDGVRQYQLVTAEKDLLEKTLRGSIKVLTDILSLVNPSAFGHASRVRKLVRALCAKLTVDQPWQCEIAAMLSQIGCVTLPPDTLERMYQVGELSADDSRMISEHPAVGSSLVANIPRLDAVSEIIAYQKKRFDGSGPPADSRAGALIPLGARILKVALDYDGLVWGGLSEAKAMAELRDRSEHYDPDVVAALETVAGLDESFEIRDIPLRDLSSNMTLADDVRTVDGALLVGRGQEVSTSMKQRLLNFARGGRIVDSVRVLVRVGSRWRTVAPAAR